MPRLLSPSPKNVMVETTWQAEIGDHVVALAWSPNGRVLAAAAADGPMTLFDAESGAIIAALPGHAFGTAAISWSADGSLLASCGQDGRVRTWDPTTGEERWGVDGGAVWVEKVAWCLDSSILASIAGRTLRLWDDQGKLLQESSDHPSTIADIQWVPGVREVTVAHYGGLTQWSADNDTPVRRFDWKGSTLVIAWSPDRNFIATGDQDATVHFWLAQQGKDLQMWGYPGKVRDLAWSPSSRYLATGGSELVVVWDCSGKGPEGSKPLMLDAHKEHVTALAYQHAGPLLASGGEDGRVALWQPGKSKMPLSRIRHEAPISRLAWTQDDKRLAIGTSAGLIHVVRP